MVIQRATTEDASEILNLQKAAYQSEAEIINDFNIEPLRQSLEEKIKELSEQVFLKLCHEGKIIGSIKGYVKDGTCYIGKVIVRPDFQNQGYGAKLMHAIEEAFPDVKRFELFTGFRSERNLYFYQKLGYQIFDERRVNEKLSLIYLEKVI